MEEKYAAELALGLDALVDMEENDDFPPELVADDPAVDERDEGETEEKDPCYDIDRLPWSR